MPDAHLRAPAPGMGTAVAKRTILRDTESWDDVASRVAFGNISLSPSHGSATAREFIDFRQHLANGTILMSGRHLQHGDIDQRVRPMEVYSNCSTSGTTHALLLLLLSGSGVGRNYSDELMIVDWDQAPSVLPCIDQAHDNWDEDCLTPKDAWITAESTCTGAVHYFKVPDSREGWAKAVERWELLAFHGARADCLILDFSDVRPKGAPIKGMQNRPSSGPRPLMRSFEKAAAITRLRYEPWEHTMRIDHAFAECVVVGGARRAARIAVKWWGDAGITRFIRIKSDIYEGEDLLWSANNSVSVDAEFWSSVEAGDAQATMVFNAVTASQYFDHTGEPGFLNVDKLHYDPRDLAGYTDGLIVGNEKYQVDDDAMYVVLGRRIQSMQYPMIVNPCGEVSILAIGGYCVVGTTAPYHAASLADARAAFELTARALIRVNTMEAFYGREVRRTNRIAVGFTGIFEFAWKFFQLTWRELIDVEQSRAFWDWMRDTRVATEQAADDQARELGLQPPMTVTSVQPAGTIAKVFHMTEGAHLPSHLWFVRWVQFQNGDPLIDEYEQRGYPVIRDLAHYKNVSIVGFPTEPLICTLDIPDDRMVTAADAPVAEQFQWLFNLEEYWLGPRGNQVSYTLKWRHDEVRTIEDYRLLMRLSLPNVRCVSVMPASDWRETQQLYGYVPEEPVSRQHYDALVAHIDAMEQRVNLEDLQCAAGACPI